jgi:hypothetical protein
MQIRVLYERKINITPNNCKSVYRSVFSTSENAIFTGYFRSVVKSSYERNKKVKSVSDLQV